MAPKILSLALFLALSMKASSTPLHDGVLDKRAHTCPKTITNKTLGEFALFAEFITETPSDGFILNCGYLLKSDPSQQTYCSYDLKSGHIIENLDKFCPDELK